MTHQEAGRRSGAARRLNPKGWRTVACNVSPSDRARLQEVMDRDGAKLGTLVREAVLSYLEEVLPLSAIASSPAPKG